MPLSVNGVVEQPSSQGTSQSSYPRPTNRKVSATVAETFNKKRKVEEISKEREIIVISDTSEDESESSSTSFELLEPELTILPPKFTEPTDEEVDDQELLNILTTLHDIGEDDFDSKELSLEMEDPPLPEKRVRLKKYHEVKPSPLFELKGHAFLSTKKKPSPYIELNPKDDSDSEEEPIALPRKFYWEKFPRFPKKIVQMGVRVKFLANVYLRKVDKTANIFIPHYTMQRGPKTVSDFFRTPKGQVCVFASGGLQNVWEKTVAYVFKCFFGMKIKVIRASWIAKHTSINLEEEYKGREFELHSELYYDLFFRNFFLSKLKGEPVSSLTIHAYSWWEVCNSCEKLLSKHRKLLPQDTTLTYKIAASRRYSHKYPLQTVVDLAQAPASMEEGVWKDVWFFVLFYVRQTFSSDEAKERFWTQTKEGLEVCKWMGQAFVENQVTLKERRSKPLSRGDVLAFYAEVEKTDSLLLQDLLKYLREVNWELSCWYKPPHYPDAVQRMWRKHWRQVVVPHFGWEPVLEYESEVKGQETGYSCEMCGHPDLHNIFLVFHPKFRVSESFLKKPIEYQATPGRRYLRMLGKIPPAIQDKRESSLLAGSECFQVLCQTQEDLEAWRKEHPVDQEEKKFEELNRREEENEALERAEKEISRRKKKKH